MTAIEKPFPMLAAAADLEKVRYPILGFPKIDGIRSVIHDAKPLSRKLITLPNLSIQKFFSDKKFQGLDGELVVGSPTDPLCIKHSTSGVMSRSGEPDFTFFVFDQWDQQGDYTHRWCKASQAVEKIGPGRVEILEPTELRNEDDLLSYEQEQLGLGFEGLILRDPAATYKHGRSTAREGGMLKIKRFQDSEALVIGVVEELFNGNEAQKDNLGRTKRSSAKAGKVGKGRMGALTVRDVKYGWEFEVGTGFTDEDKAEWWRWYTSDGIAKKPRLIKYKYFSVGMQDKPRHPVFLSIRNPMDM